MSRVHLDFSIDGETQLSRFFDLAETVTRDLTGVFEEWAEDFRETQHGVFSQEGAFEGRSRWEELSPKYREWKEANYPGQPILVLTGRMRGALTDEQHHEHVEQITKDSLAIGARVEYAGFHQHGTRKMPQRKVIELTEPQKLRWVQIARRVTWEQLEEAAQEAQVMR